MTCDVALISHTKTAEAGIATHGAAATTYVWSPNPAHIVALESPPVVSAIVCHLVLHIRDVLWDVQVAQVSDHDVGQVGLADGGADIVVDALGENNLGVLGAPGKRLLNRWRVASGTVAALPLRGNHTLCQCSGACNLVSEADRQCAHSLGNHLVA